MILDLILALDEATDFVSKAITYLSYQFPLRDDGTTFTFSRDDQKRSIETFLNLSNLLPPTSENGEKTSSYDSLLFERPFWRDIPTHLADDPELDLERIAAYHMANPAYRHAQYNEERCENEDGQSLLGSRIVQSYVDIGVPFEATSSFWIMSSPPLPPLVMRLYVRQCNSLPAIPFADQPGGESTW
ncbi:unnamed protein product [Nippostrongylus brasiliensis]|uniref:COesterase domain-containing protein n=1 Tax=Nippostrongylus brasiliensis TaxID=27835 RepID=A0A0N4XWY5_NIPBR|nr:unnamed protein product [Nippostrongylus brasiliensis]